jgi:hypothetical protein
VLVAQTELLDCTFVVTDGGAPTAVQRKRHHEVFSGKPSKVAVVTTVLRTSVSAGLPAAQVSQMTPNGRLKMTGGVGIPTTSTSQGYASILIRAISGIPVADSFAWATFNADGDVVIEAAYWPTIPAGVIADAKALAASVADSVGGPAFLAKLPTGLASGTVVIRHSPPTPTSRFEAFASYDLSEESTAHSAPRIRHLNATGVEFKLASEQPVLVNSDQHRP